MSGHKVAALEQRLAEAHTEHQRAHQRHGDVAECLKAQLRDLHEEMRSQREELRERDGRSGDIRRHLLYIIYLIFKRKA